MLAIVRKKKMVRLNNPRAKVHSIPDEKWQCYTVQAFGLEKPSNWFQVKPIV